jgi:capsular polysaccharide biosynthesis protein
MRSQLKLAQARHLVKIAIPRNSRLLGVSFPDRAFTESHYLESVGDEIFLVKSSEKAAITRTGVIRSRLNFLDTDYGAFAAMSDLFSFDRKKTRFPKLVSLWAHNWTSYYHWLIDVAPKIATCKLHFGNATSDLTFVYPRALTTYEKDTLALLDIDPNNVINSYETGTLVSPEIFAMPLPGWVKISPRIFNLRRLLAPNPTLEKRLYISRSGRRKIVNESELSPLLQRYGFEFIEDRPRSLSEQIDLFSSASHIVAPHGAALSNILWSSKSVKILELASASYSPKYFDVLATMLDQRLDKLIFGEGSGHWANLEDDFAVDLPGVERFLKETWQL